MKGYEKERHSCQRDQGLTRLHLKTRIWKPINPVLDELPARSSNMVKRKLVDHQVFGQAIREVYNAKNLFS